MAEKLCAISGILCVLYFVGIALYAGLSSKFPFIWAVAGIGFFAAAVWLRMGVRIPLWIKIPALGAGGILLAVFLFVEVLIVSAMFQKPEENLDYVIVLGAQVKGSRPSLSLKYRVDAAEEYLKKNPGTKAVLSGGQGKGEEISEAECMYRELVKQGIAKARLLKEDKSTSTSENIDFSYETVTRDRGKNPGELKVGIVTNSFHVYRGSAIARKKTDFQIWGISAKSNRFLQVNYLVREFLGVLKDKAAGNL